MILFGTNRQFTLEDAPFSRAGAFLSIYQFRGDKQLYLTHCRSEAVVLDRPNLMRIAFIGKAGTELPFIYHSDESCLTVKTPEGVAQFTYETPQVLRVRVCGVIARVFHEPEMHEGAAIRREGNELEAAFNFKGKLLFKRISGVMTTEAQWNFREVSPFPYKIDIMESIDGAGEVAIHEYYSNGVTFESYKEFDQARADMLAEFEQFNTVYAKVAPVYKEMARRAAWIAWISRMGPQGSLTDTVVYMHKLLLVCASGWQQCFAALAMRQNIKEAWRLILSFFNFQDERGGLPDNVTDMNQAIWVSTKPPLFGYTICYMLDNFDTTPLAIEDYERMYDRLSKYREWWYTNHDHAHTGLPAYYHPDESGYDEATIFEAGLPLQSPDLMAYMVFTNEALARLAKRLNKTDEAERWQSESQRVIDFLINELWDGEQFLGKATKTGALHKCGCAAQLQPICLGSRLPKDIIDKITARLTDEEDFLTDCGITSESQKSEKFRVFSFTRGPVIAPVNMLMINGLFDAGKIDAARLIAARYLNAVLVNGPALGYSTFRKEPKTWQDIPFSEDKGQIRAPLMSWGSAVFLSLANRIMDNA
ncbi:MAG: hypothetical protein LBL96_03900 [Clostridiales bacterium]|jgi:hypothetical protein|nr:hypothetical protein [Clostridiales bacterium]